MYFDDITTASGCVEPVDILCDQSEIGDVFFNFGEEQMSLVRDACSDEFSPPGVELPDKLWISMEGKWSCEFLRPIGTPKAIGAAEGRDSALS
jgi:hypothetical protein